MCVIGVTLSWNLKLHHSIQLHTYMYAYMYAYIYIHTCRGRSVWECVCVYVTLSRNSKGVGIQAFACVHACTHTRMYVYVLKYIHASCESFRLSCIYDRHCIHTYIHTSLVSFTIIIGMYTHKHIHVCTHTHVSPCRGPYTQTHMHVKCLTMPSPIHTNTYTCVHAYTCLTLP